MDQLFVAIESGQVEAVRAVVDEQRRDGGDGQGGGGGGDERVDALLRTMGVLHVMGVDGANETYRLPPLECAAQLGQLEVLLLLLRLGARWVDADGQLAHRALASVIGCAGGELGVEAVEQVLDSGVSPSYNNEQALKVAAARRRVDVLRLLVGRGCDVNRVDELGWTPLKVAAANGFVDVAEFLVEAGSSVSTVDRFGRVPLMYAAQENRVEMIRFLVEHGASVRGVDFCGRSALHLAAHEGHVEVIKVLVQLGADPLRGVGQGDTALRRAKRQEVKDVLSRAEARARLFVVLLGLRAGGRETSLARLAVHSAFDVNVFRIVLELLQ